MMGGGTKRRREEIDTASVQFGNAFNQDASLCTDLDIELEVMVNRYRIQCRKQEFFKEKDPELRVKLAGDIRCYAELILFLQVEQLSRIHPDVKKLKENLVPFFTTTKMGKEDLMLLLYPNPNSTLIYPNPNDSN